MRTLSRKRPRLTPSSIYVSLSRPFRTTFWAFFANTYFLLHPGATIAILPARFIVEKVFMLTKRTWLALALILACPALTYAQLRLTQADVNLGGLRGGPAYSHRFEFVNDSAQALEITDLRLGCGCLQAVLDKRIYQAGERGALLMNLRTLGQPNGTRTWQIHVHYR